MAEKPLDRRRFLYATGLTGVALLAGCSSDDGNGDGGDGGDGSDGDGDGSDGEDDGDGDGGDGDGGGDVPSEVEEYLSNAMGYEGDVVDATGEDNPTVDVGAGSGLSFDPAAVRVSAGTTVTWVWTGQGGGHNVIHEGGDFDSGERTREEGHEFEHTFEGSGHYRYYCDPHKPSGMKGAVIVE